MSERQPVRSIVILDECRTNKCKESNLEADTYHPVYVQVGSDFIPALFTKSQIITAVQRAKRNPEDVDLMYQVSEEYPEELEPSDNTATTEEQLKSGTLQQVKDYFISWFY